MFLVLDLRKYKKSIKLVLFILIILFFIFVIKGFINYILPIEYENIIEKYSNEYNLEKELIFSIINAESRFNKDAVSSKGAVGLMQVMPDTAIWMVQKAYFEDFHIDSLYEPDVNIKIGCFYLNYLLKKHNNETLAIASYNAGSTNVSRWINDEKYSDGVRLHTIPFNETDKYIKKINIFKKCYNILFKIRGFYKNIFNI